MNPTAHIQNLRGKLKLRSLTAKSEFGKKHPHAQNFFASKGIDLGKIRAHSAKLLASGALGGALLLSPGKTDATTIQSPVPESVLQALQPLNLEGEVNLRQDPQGWLVNQLNIVLPPIRDRWALPFLTQDEEKAIGRAIQKATGIPAVANLEGEHLNTVYGYTGAEQHLPRFPGDNIGKHGELQEAGITASTGAFGYFAQDGQLTEDAVTREKYYVAVQTLYLPDWNQRWKYLKEWYKWRKIIMVNVENGNAVVAVVGDAGPAAWTGKHFGGSPEVMNNLGGPRYKKGRVLLYFVDDPHNRIPLGPILYNQIKEVGDKIKLTLVPSPKSSSF